MILANHGIVSSSGGLPPSTLLTNLYAVYKAESNANDSLATYNGTSVGGLTYSAGKSGNAFTFNGTNAYVSLPNNSLNFTGDFSISLWLYCKTITTTNDLIDSNNYNGSVSGGWRFLHNGSGIIFEVYQTDAASSKSIYTIPFTSSVYNNQWVHITLTRKQSTATKTYVNGIEVSGVFSRGNATFNPTYLATTYANIGAWKSDAFGASAYCVNGSQIDELNAWNKELTATEVTELYNAGTGKFYPY